MGGIHIDAAGLGGYGHADAAGKAALVCAVNVRDDFSTTDPEVGGCSDTVSGVSCTALKFARIVS